MNFLKELNKIDVKDIKNINFGQIKSTLQNQVEISISLGLIVASLVVVVYLAQGHKKEGDQLSLKVSQLREKLKIVKEQEEAQKNYTDFVQQSPPAIPTDQLINKISELAVKHKIQIQSFSPAEEMDQEFWHLTNLNLNISAKNYKSIILFVQDVENLPYAIQIQKWSGRSRDINSYNEGDNKNPDIIEANIKIGSITFKK